mgnify:CR=1 FL=1
MKPYLKKRPGRAPNRPAEKGGATMSEKRMREYLSIAGQAVLLLRRAVDEWREDRPFLSQVPTVIKDGWMRDFLTEAQKIVGDPSLPRGPHETPEL